MAARYVEPDREAQSEQTLISWVALGKELLTVGKCLLKVLKSFNPLLIVELEHTDVIQKLRRYHCLAKVDVVTGTLETRRPLLHEFEGSSVAGSLARLSWTLRGEVVAHDGDALLVVNKGTFWLILLEKSRDFKIGVVIVRVELADLTEQLQSFLLVGRGPRLASFDLGQQANGLVAVLVAWTPNHSVEVSLSHLEVTHVEEHLREAEESRVIQLVVPQ